MATAIAGWAHTPFAKYDNESVESLIVRVTNEALAHAGVSAADASIARQLSRSTDRTHDHNKVRRPSGPVSRLRRRDSLSADRLIRSSTRTPRLPCRCPL